MTQWSLKKTLHTSLTGWPSPPPGSTLSPGRPAAGLQPRRGASPWELPTWLLGRSDLALTSKCPPSLSPLLPLLSFCFSSQRTGTSLSEAVSEGRKTIKVSLYHLWCFYHSVSPTSRSEKTPSLMMFPRSKNILARPLSGRSWVLWYPLSTTARQISDAVRVLKLDHHCWML